VSMALSPDGQGPGPLALRHVRLSLPVTDNSVAWKRNWWCRPWLDRVSAADLIQFATGDGRAAGHIGAVLVLDAAPGFSF
jgi:hypothetical protein